VSLVANGMVELASAIAELGIDIKYSLWDDFIGGK